MVRSKVPHDLPRDIRFALTIAAAALGGIGIYSIWVAGEIAKRDQTVPAFFGFVLTAVLGGLMQYGKWVLDYHAAVTNGRPPAPIDVETTEAISGPVT